MNSTVLENIKNLNKCRQNLKNGEYGLISESQFEERMKKRFQEFYDRYPKIFEKAVKGFFEDPDEINRLKLAINTQNDISSGKIAEKEGGVIFGQNLVDTYVKPQLKDNPSNPPSNTPNISYSSSTSSDKPSNVQNSSNDSLNVSSNVSEKINDNINNESENESDSDSDNENDKDHFNGLLNDIVMTKYELCAGDLKKKVKIDSDDESEDESS
uniref:Uncharacterized protein n=1 Tax=viral metagenome TaxID=1070528 RepID=A0A6C0E699_9ZZZZ